MRFVRVAGLLVATFVTFTLAAALQSMDRPDAAQAAQRPVSAAPAHAPVSTPAPAPESPLAQAPESPPGQAPGSPPTQAPDQAEIEFIGNGRFLSNAVRVGNTLYLSGQLGIRGERGITPETRAAMENIKSLLEANGATIDDVVKCTVFLADFAEWGAMNDVYAPYFTKHRPTRSAVAVSGLAANARVEIECMAVIGARNAP